MMVNLRNLKNGWSNLPRLVKPYLDYGGQRCLELVRICAGIDPITGPEAWKRKLLVLYNLWGFCQLMVTLARVALSIYYREDLIEFCSSSMTLVTCVACLIKVYALEHYRGIVLQSKAFINSKFVRSGDPDYDKSVRRTAARTAGNVTLGIFLLMCFNQVTMMVPNSARNRLFGIPKKFHELGPTVAPFLQEAYVFMIIMIWGSRYFCYSFTVLPLLLGLRSELMIVARGFETLLTRVEIQISEDRNFVAGPSRESHSNMLKWKYLKQNVAATLEEHVEVLRNIQLIRNLVSDLYAITYYSTMMIISIAALLVIKSGITLISLVIFGSVSVFIVEGYFWCHLIDSVEEIMESIAGSVAQLGTELEHSSEHHSVYIQMRTSLMITQLISSQQNWFSCGGVFPISMESFADWCMIIYRGITFLLQLE